MPLLLDEITSPTDFNALVQCESLSYATPLNTFFRLFRPDPSPAGFISLRDRQIKQWREDSSCRWFKVVDTEIDMVVGGACWNVFLEDPYGEGKRGVEGEAGWWGEGEEREFAERLLGCFWGQRWEKMGRPHLLLAMLFVHPEHRRRGIARQLINWGIQEADRLGLETFIEATDDGKPCYEACGFVYMGTNYWEAAKRNPSKKWMELERYLQTPIHTYLMWRPVGGKFVEGETKGSWEE